jgi:hypothetical protein
MDSLKKTIQKSIDLSQQQAGYGFSLIPYHTHDGVNSPKLPTPPAAATTTYGGYIKTSSVLPTGWSVTNPSTGNYTVTHSLNSTSYAVSCTPFGLGRLRLVSIDANSFQINYRDAAMADANIDWSFVLTKIV